MKEIRVVIFNRTHDKEYNVDGIRFIFSTGVGPLVFEEKQLNEDKFTILCFGNNHLHLPTVDSLKDLPEELGFVVIHDEEIDEDWSDTKDIPLFGSLDFNKEVPTLSSTSAKVHTIVNVVRDVCFNHSKDLCMNEIMNRLDNLSLLDKHKELTKEDDSISFVADMITPQVAIATVPPRRVNIFILGDFTRNFIDVIMSDLYDTYGSHLDQLVISPTYFTDEQITSFEDPNSNNVIILEHKKVWLDKLEKLLSYNIAGVETALLGIGKGKMPDDDSRFIKLGNVVLKSGIVGSRVNWFGNVFPITDKVIIRGFKRYLKTVIDHFLQTQKDGTYGCYTGTESLLTKPLPYDDVKRKPPMKMPIYPYKLGKDEL